MSLPKEEPEFDFVFAGAGMAAASLLARMLERKEFRFSRILIADPLPFAAGEKTWCFWEKGRGFFELLVEKSWEKAWFRTGDFSSKLELPPYRYKMIQSRALFEFILDELKKRPDIQLVNEKVISSSADSQGVNVVLSDGRTIRSKMLFNSIPEEPPRKQGHFYLLQHFRGWFIKTENIAFDPETATLMDFSIDQGGDCRFVYVLPFSPTEALVEFTVFSEHLLKENEYSAALENYLKKLVPDGYQIRRFESGVIPMYSAPFPPSSHPAIIQLGTRGGMTKASTGYTFMKVQKHSDALIKGLISGKMPASAPGFLSRRFFWFDRVLLRILAEKRLSGSSIFSALFKKNPVQRVFRFLDEESTLAEDLQIMNSVPTGKFLLPGIREALRGK